MGNLRNLVPVSGRKSAALGISVMGTILRMSDEIVKRIGATDHVNFSIDGNRLYIWLNPDPTAAPYKLLGKEGHRRYVNDSGVVKAAKLGSGNHTLTYDEVLKANFITFDPSAPEPEPPAKRVREKGEGAKAEKSAASKTPVKGK